MAVEIKETAFGKLVPDYLLGFKGASKLQLYYSNLLKTNYKKGFDKLDLGQCTACHAAQTVYDRPRLKSPSKMTSKIHRLLKRQSAGKQLGKYGQHIVNKFLQSKQHMIVKCTNCQSINGLNLMSKEDLIVLRNQRLMQVKDIAQQEKEPKSKKKKKKKKKQKAVECFAPNSLLLLPKNDLDSTMSQQSTKKKGSLGNSGFSSQTQDKKQESLQELIKPLKKESLSSSGLFRKSLGNTEIIHKNSYQKKHCDKKKPVSRQKELKAFLKESVVSEKSASLTDFLSSL